MDADLQKIIDAETPYLRATEDGKVECILNGHTFPPKKDVIEAFIKGKKYSKLKIRKDAEDNIKKWEPFLSQSINFPAMLFCALTNQLIHKNTDAIKLHIKGKRFERAQERFNQDRQELFEEPSLDDMDLDEEEPAEKEAAAAEVAEGDDDGDIGILIPVGALSDEEEESNGEEEEEEEEIKKKIVPKGKSAKKQPAKKKIDEVSHKAKAANGKSSASIKNKSGGAATAKRKNPSRHPAKKSRT